MVTVEYKPNGGFNIPSKSGITIVGSFTIPNSLYNTNWRPSAIVAFQIYPAGETGYYKLNVRRIGCDYDFITKGGVQVTSCTCNFGINNISDTNITVNSAKVKIYFTRQVRTVYPDYAPTDMTFSIIS